MLWRASSVLSRSSRRTRWLGRAGPTDFHDVRGLGDYEVAKLLNELEIDIAVDLKGYTQNSRFGIFARIGRRPSR